MITQLKPGHITSDDGSFRPSSPVHIVHKQDTISQKVIFLYCLNFFFFFWTKLLPAVSSKFVLNVDATEWPH